MKKFSLAILLATSFIAISSYANAKYTGPSDAKKTTVSEVANMPDDSFVILEGTITSKTGNEAYIFADSTGSVAIEIDDEDMNGVNVGAEDIIIIQGEVDKNGNLVEIDVDEIMMPQ
ncbi:MAG: NirD/YgiW/YdeI family stress tolerance protein [Alphaproteobacteria bacterium]|nr:NirD/YgiW/YdeI family stress tolerance protein [Alphaproteobacteria bacterium]